MSTQTIQSRGIYHGLPVFPLIHHQPHSHNNRRKWNIRKLYAPGVGPGSERWSKIYCLSRRPPTIPDGLPKNAEHIALDFLNKPEEIAKVLKEKGVQKVDYVFFYSYVQVKPKEGEGLWSDVEEMCRVNVALLQNFCEALPLASLKPKRIMLQTGAKNYGIHLGPAAMPQEETAPRVTLAPNFYYPQEDFLWDFCLKQGIAWNICMPSYILGAVPDAAMNLVYPLGIYASVKRHLGESLEFPSDLHSWETTHVASSSTLNAHLEEWAVLNPRASNERFNTADSSPFTWGNFWSKLAGWYGVEAGRPDADQGVYREIVTPYDPPPRGFGPPTTYRSKFTLTDWAKEPRNQRAWADIIEANDLNSAQKLEDMDVDRIFGFTDGSLLGGSLDLSMNKARKLGWHGFVDTNDCIREVLDDFAKLKMLPPVAK